MLRPSDTLEREKKIETEAKEQNVYYTTLGFFTISFIAVLVILLILIVGGGFRYETIKGDSMYPTLKNNERVVMRGANSFFPVKRNDIIVFQANEVDNQLKYNNPNATNQTSYVKRVIAVEGDSVKFNGKDIYVNGKKIKQPYLEPHNYADTKIDVAQEDILPSQADKWSLVSLSDMISSITGKVSWNKYSRNLTINKVPKNCYFVLGDNRSVSNDSRYYGFVPKQAIQGVLLDNHMKNNN